MKRLLFLALVSCSITLLSCDLQDEKQNNKTALIEQNHTESNQASLLNAQPLPNITWSLERDNLTKRFKLQNDRSISFFMYIFVEGVGTPIGYYQVNKVSSVNSQLSATQQIISGLHSSNDIPRDQIAVIESPAEDGSYGTNGTGVFGFTPEDIYIETNMKYITSTVPLAFNQPVAKLAVITTEDAKKLLEASKVAMNK